MLIATLIITIVTLVRRRLRRRTDSAPSADRASTPKRWIDLRRPVPIMTAAVTLIGIAVAAGALAQC
jgi:hypothetical protein